MIKSRLGIADVVGQYLKLERAGLNFRARCPFHNEKSPSFMVSPSRDTYHCFGCNKGGDIFSFVQEVEGVEFREALRVLAEKAGVELKNESSGEEGRRARLFALMEDAVAFYEAELKKMPLAEEYLKGRGVTAESIKSFRIGFAPQDWRTLSTHLRSKKWRDVEIEEVGLGIPPQSGTGGLYDRFRSRIMFPLSDGSGRIVGFSGRIFGGDDTMAKYLNSPQTVLFDKSRILYGFDRAKHAIREHGSCILVEGQMDLVMSHQAGLRNTVATSGTALTDDHLRSIRRLTDTLLMAFDPDAAGVRAAKRGTDMALSQGFDVKAIYVPGEKDPADIIRDDVESWKKSVSEASHVVTFMLRHLTSTVSDPRELRERASKDVIPYIARLESPVARAHFIREAANALILDEAPIAEEIHMFLRNASQAPQSYSQESRPAQKKEMDRTHAAAARLAGFLTWQAKHPKPVANEEAIHAELSASEGALKALRSVSEEDRNRFAYEAEIAHMESDDRVMAGLVTELVFSLREAELTEALERSHAELRRAENGGDETAIEQKLNVCQDISLRLNALRAAYQQTSNTEL